jgi:hypothetical protein
MIFDKQVGNTLLVEMRRGASPPTTERLLTLSLSHEGRGNP